MVAYVKLCRTLCVGAVKWALGVLDTAVSFDSLISSIAPAGSDDQVLQSGACMAQQCDEQKQLKNLRMTFSVFWAGALAIAAGAL